MHMTLNKLASVVLLLAAAHAVSGATIVIDEFTPTSSFVIVTGAPLGIKSASDSDATVLGEAIGNERDIFVARTSSNSGTVIVDTNGSIPGALSYGSGSDTTGWTLLTYDGVDNAAGTDTDPGAPFVFDPQINYSGLGGLDLTGGGTNDAFHLATASDLGGSLLLTVYSSATNFSTALITIAADGAVLTFDDVFASFASFVMGVGATGVADFTNVGAITMYLKGDTASTDIAVDVFEVTAIPLPAAAWIGMLGLGAVGFARRRFAQLTA